MQRVPLKVVPMFIDEHSLELPEDVDSQPQVSPELSPDAEQHQQEESGAHAPLPWAGALAIALGILAAISQAAGIVTASAGGFEGGIVLGYLAVAVAIAAVFAGITAIIIKRGRRTGMIGILLGIVANPLLLLAILGLVDQVGS